MIDVWTIFFSTCCFQIVPCLILFLARFWRLVLCRCINMDRNTSFPSSSWYCCSLLPALPDAPGVSLRTVFVSLLMIFATNYDES